MRRSPVSSVATSVPRSLSNLARPRVASSTTITAAPLPLPPTLLPVSPTLQPHTLLPTQPNSTTIPILLFAAPNLGCPLTEAGDDLRYIVNKRRSALEESVLPDIKQWIEGTSITFGNMPGSPVPGSQLHCWFV